MNVDFFMYNCCSFIIFWYCRYELVIDDKDEQDKKKPASTSETDNIAKTFYYGGSPISSIQNFTGCISNAYISRYCNTLFYTTLHPKDI